MKEQLVLLLLLSVVLSDPTNIVRLQQCCRNTIRFASGFIEPKTQLPYVNNNNNFTYKFVGVPNWMTVSGSTLSGQPIPGLVGSFNVNVSYFQNDTKLGETSFALVAGLTPLQKKLEVVTDPSQIYFLQDLVTAPGTGFNFIAIYPTVASPKVSDTKNKGATLAAADTKSVLTGDSSSTTSTTSNSKSADAEKDDRRGKTTVATVTVTAASKTASADASTSVGTEDASSTVIPTIVPTITIISANGHTRVITDASNTPLELVDNLEQDCKNKYGTLSEARTKLDGLNQKSKAGWDTLKKAQDTLSAALKSRGALETELEIYYRAQDEADHAALLQQTVNQNQQEVNAADKLITEFTKKLNDSEAYLANLTAKRNELDAKQQSERIRLQGIFDSYKQYETELQQTANLVKQLETNISGITYQLSMNEQAKQLNEYRVARAKQELEAATKEQQQIAQGIDALVIVKADTEKRLNETNTKFFSLSDKTNALRDSITPTVDASTNYDGQISTVKAEIANTKSQKSYVEATKAQLEGNVKHAQNELDAFKKKKVNSTRKIEAIQDDLIKASSNIKNLSKAVSQAKDEQDAIENRVAAVNNYITLNYDLLQKCELLSKTITVVKAADIKGKADTATATTAKTTTVKTVAGTTGTSTTTTTTTSGTTTTTSSTGATPSSVAKTTQAAIDPESVTITVTALDKDADKSKLAAKL